MMMNFAKGLWMVLLASVLSACTGLSVDDRSIPHYQRGWVSVDEGQFYVRACQAADAQLLSKPPRQLQQLFNQREVKTPLYIEWLGQTHSGQAGVSISQLRYVTSDPSACQHLLNDVLLQAMGARPDWQLSITDDHLRVFLPQQRRTLVFPVGQVMRQGAEWWWEAEIEGRNRKHRLSLKVHPAPCQQDQDWFGLTANLLLDGVVYTGCAKRGNLARLELFTEYQLATAMETRDIRLQLRADGSATLSEDYLNQQPALVSRGRWQQLSNGRLLVNLDDPDAKLNQETLMFAITDQGISLSGFHPRYGHQGLHLQASGHPMPWSVGRLRVP